MCRISVHDLYGSYKYIYMSDNLRVKKVVFSRIFGVHGGQH